MTDTVQAYPLAWPIGWQRTAPQDRTGAKFNRKSSETKRWADGTSTTWQTQKRVTIHEGTQRVLSTLERMGIDTIDDVVISSDLVLRLDGLPRSGQRDPDDQGVAVYWVTASGEQRCMAIDRYDRIADNLAAIAATLEAMRAIERHGGAEILDRAFTNFVALPAPGVEPWWSVLGFMSEAEALADGNFEIQAKKLMQKYHPDNQDTGDEWRFKQITKARNEGRQARAHS